MTKPMSKIEKLIAELCPNGVEFKDLGRLAIFENTGVDKKIVDSEQRVRLLNYMDVYNNKHINRDILKMEVSASDSKIKNCNIEKGDIFITPTSETIDDIGHAAVADENISGAVYSYHIMRIRLNEKNDTAPYFISYLFESDIIQKQILKLATGMTRFGLKKSKFESIKIPLPPLAIQEEIVKILDSFTELEAELEARKKQYEYYREELLTCNQKINRKTLGEATLLTNNIKWKDTNKTYKYIDLTSVSREDHSIYEPVEIDANNAPSRAQKLIQKDDVIFATTRPTLRRFTLIGNNFDGQVASTGYCVLRANKNIVLPKWIYFNIASNVFNDYVEKNQEGSAYPSISDAKVKSFIIPIPPLAEQERIITILDKFDALVNDISIGLPAELSARRSQYEYYRNKLLTFEPLNNNY